MKPRMGIPWIFALLPSCLLVATPTLGQELDEGEFETWKSVELHSPPEESFDQGLTKSSGEASRAGQIITKPASSALTFPAESKQKQEQNQEESESRASSLFGSLNDQWEKQYFIRFGAGASWMIPLRLSDRANGERLMSEFSLSWAPAGMIAEVGVDLGISRDNMFELKPNLKFFFLNNKWFSVYGEGGCDMIFFSEGKEVGAGVGLGFVIGIMENLAIEIKASASMFSLSEKAAGRLLELNDDVSEVQTSELSILPSLTARIAARF